MPKDAIVISNHTDKELELTTIQDSSVADGDRKKTIVITPKESYVIFTDRVESIIWNKKK